MSNYSIWFGAGGRGGKAGRGKNKTSSVQVREYSTTTGYLLVKQFRFVVGNPASKKRAMIKAGQWIDQHREPVRVLDETDEPEQEES